MVTLSGGSGCVLELQGQIVRKTAGSTSYNPRLLEQYKKQSQYTNPLFHTPKIIHSGYTNSLFYFDMEYINGMRFAEYITTIPISYCAPLVQKLTALIPAHIEPSIQAVEVVQAKIAEMREKTKHSRVANLSKAFEKLDAADWSLASHSTCHGDMTFENILIKDGELYLIDFLDSFYNSWAIDISKLLQDLELRWSYRTSNINENANIRLLIMKQLLLDHVRSHAQGAALEQLLYNLLLLHIIRIIPYVKNNDTSLIEHFIGNLCGK